MPLVILFQNEVFVSRTVVATSFTSSLTQVAKFSSFIFFFNNPATPEIYPFSLHDALPISRCPASPEFTAVVAFQPVVRLWVDCGWVASRSPEVPLAGASGQAASSP